MTWRSVRLLLPVFVLALLAPALPAAEGRRPVWMPNTVITSPGTYVVTRNLNAAGSGLPVLDIQARDVEVDLNGFQLTGDPGAPVIRSVSPVGVDNVTVRNGTLLKGARGYEHLNGSKVTLEDVLVLGSALEGVYLAGVTDFAIRRCNFLDVQGIAIFIDGLTATPSVQGTIEGNRIERGGGGIFVVRGSSVGILNNRLEELTLGPSPNPPAHGAIVYDYSDAGLIADNTIQTVHAPTATDGNGIYLGDASGCKVHDNVVRDTVNDGIALAGMSDDNLVLENVVTHCIRDGLRIEGSRNHAERNVLNSNCRGGGGACWGLHYLAAWGGNGNTFGRNTARGNAGMPGACPAMPPVVYPPTTDFCDQQFGNGSFNDNYMPNLF